jgi:hypothetical protein
MNRGKRQWKRRRSRIPAKKYVALLTLERLEGDEHGRVGRQGGDTGTTVTEDELQEP